MPTVKVVAGTASVELEATEMDVAKLAELAVLTLHKAHVVEQDANAKKAANIGGYS